MKRGCFTFSLLLLLMPNVYFISLIKAEIEEDTWMDPDAWARDYQISGVLRPTSGKCCKCSEDMKHELSEPQELKKQRQASAEDEPSLIYFKKFITTLFNRKNFKYDSTQQIYERSIVFTIQSFQMDKLEQLQDPRDLDNILAEIFNNVRTPNMYREGQQQLHTTEASSGFTAIVSNIFYDILQLTKTSEIRFLLGVAIIILIAWILNNRYNIGWLTLVFGGVFIYGYLHTYLECNREIEVNEMLKILKRDKGSEKIAKGFNMINFFKGMFFSDNMEDLQQQRIKETAKLSLGFCRPDHVLIIYFNDIFLKYLQVLIEQCTVTLTVLNGTLGFPYNILSGFLLVYIILYISKLTFKYIFSPSAWVQFLHRKQLYHSEHATIKSRTTSEDDRISGNNLKLLLKAINAEPERTAIASKLPTVAVVSGVEDISEAIEPNSENIAQQLDKHKVGKNNNDIFNEKPLDKKTDGKMEDLFEDS